jgi:hypothetical protein
MDQLASYGQAGIHHGPTHTSMWICDLCYMIIVILNVLYFKELLNSSYAAFGQITVILSCPTNMYAELSAAQCSGGKCLCDLRKWVMLKVEGQQQ